MNTTVRFKSLPEPPVEVSDVRFEEVVTVRRIVGVAAFLMLIALLALGASTFNAGPWTSNLNSGIAKSRASGKPLFVLVAKTGCTACAQMENNMASGQGAQALKSVVVVRLESDLNPNFNARYASGGTPTTVIFGSGNYSRPVYVYTGVMNPGTLSQVGRSLKGM